MPQYQSATNETKAVEADVVFTVKQVYHYYLNSMSLPPIAASERVDLLI
jgi:hypothetical protein